MKFIFRYRFLTGKQGNNLNKYPVKYLIKYFGKMQSYFSKNRKTTGFIIL